MAFKGFFDGGNEADSRKYKIVTLAGFSGSGAQWDHFTEQWNRVLAAHQARFLHTTDALALEGHFKREKGWTEAGVEAFIGDCVSVIERSTTTRRGDIFSFKGLRPVTVSVVLGDFMRALRKFPKLGSAEHLCAIHAVARCTAWGRFTGYSKFRFYFDQGERFCGHIRDRMENKKARRAAPEIRNIICAAEVNMREAPALQAADVLAWSVNRKYEEGRVRYGWQKRLLALDRDADVFDYSRLSRPILRNVETVDSWNLPPRRRPV
jgi:hypothetical protein